LSKFDHLKKFEVSKDAVRYDLDQLTGGMYLMVRPATEANKGLLSESLKRVNARPQRARRAKVSAEKLEQTRDEDRQLYAKHVVEGWGNVRDSDGKVVEFSKEEVLDFLTALPDWVFDELRAFCTDPNNFLGDLPEDEGGDESLGKS
jgi:hypothetical protein